MCGSGLSGATLGNHLTHEVNLPGFCPAVEPERLLQRLRPVALGPGAARAFVARSRNPSDPSVGDARSLPACYMATNVPTDILEKSKRISIGQIFERPTFMQAPVKLHDVSATWANVYDAGTGIGIGGDQADFVESVLRKDGPWGQFPHPMFGTRTFANTQMNRGRLFGAPKKKPPCGGFELILFVVNLYALAPISATKRRRATGIVRSPERSINRRDCLNQERLHGKHLQCYFQGVTGGTAQGPSTSTVVKSAGETISRYSMSFE